MTSHVYVQLANSGGRGDEAYPNSDEELHLGAFSNADREVATVRLPGDEREPPANGNWPLVATPLLVLAAIVAFLVTGPGTEGFLNDRIYKNATVIISAAPAQIITFVWIFAVVVRVWRKSRGLDEASVFPIVNTLRRGQLERVAMVAALVFVVMMAFYLGVFWRPGDNTLKSFHVPFANVIGQLLVLVPPLLVFAVPCLPAWEARKMFFRTLLECFGCVVGYPILSRGRVEFRHVFVTDVLTSAAAILWEVSYSICRFSHNPW